MKDITKQVAGAMVVFVQGDKWRFSYISKRKVKNKETNTIEDKETAPKRYTYLFGKGEKALTAAQRFDKLIQKQKDNLFDLLSLDDFEDAFSVEKLSKEFFKSYKEIYEHFVEFITGKRYVKKGSKWTEIQIHEAHFQLRNYFDNDSKQARDFVKRMLGRIVFLYFIQKKGWLAVPKGKKWDEGNPEYLFELFKNAKYKESFYSDYLVPLFFETLNNPNVQKENNELRFPYLNGGLFDKTQDYKYDKLALPSEIFEKLFSTFNNYNFTIYEDAPDEHTIAVDPEMLGHIFENLLEDNKDKGAFYTPKEIVHYMCKESLKTYLLAQDEKLFADELAKTSLEKIIQQQELNEDEKAFAEKNAYRIIDALEKVKICDPAIGSGAFPMGLLQEIFNAQIYLQELKGFKKAKSDADIKKHIIEESIYGVDVDAGAVDIARLRFWLSLVVDEEVPQPLPNLAFKIVCANTLIPLSTDKSNQYQIAGATDIIKEIEKVRHNYFDSSKEEKKDLERQFKNLQNKLWNTAKDWVISKDADLYQRLLEFNPFEDKSCSWFDPWWMFGVKDGFDIVIGNPPYLRIQGIRDSNPKLADALTKIYKSASGSFDLYVVFVERALQIVKANGVVNFIMPTKWTNAAFGKGLRQILSDKNAANKIIYFGAYQVFDASTYTGIQFFKANSDELSYYELDRDLKSNDELSDYLQSLTPISGTFIANSKLTSDIWTLTAGGTSKIIDKLNLQPRRISDIFEKIFQGLATSKDDVYFLYDCVDEGDDIIGFSKQLNKSIKIERGFVKPLLKGEDVHRYDNITSNRVVVFPYKLENGNAELYKEDEIKNQFPLAYAYLKECESILRDREKGRFNIDDEWFQFGRKQGINFAEKEKLVAPEISLGGNFAYDKNGRFYSTTKVYGYIKKDGVKESYLFWLGLFNSKLFWYFIQQTGYVLRGGYFTFKTNYILPFPVPKIIPTETISAVEELVKKILKKKENSYRKNILNEEKEIDNFIYKLYDLKTDEISEIER
ncbi:Eco57I restriction-modification methylase domain-containing protein [Pedobacter montanisoli]|uniref:site-specific DNA-methyltransferase (adenine-specific) n=1 Tax=Pedobacter montanisoli TaxID=2923277 RepID=A0ABS9ZYV2_9SPHI|nr:Eco57I restriction-modification methylase domain-containing protein [Pedobacter montanisoli]MCJ0743465.1 Eco57I restriction-modification methylase domain-containing protein [Pedobacter montanisoli]